MKKDWVLIIIIGLIILIGLGLFGYLKMSKKEISANPVPSSSNQISPSASSSSADYFSADAKVMFFYSPYCHWCQQEEQQVFPELAKQGYKVKPMDVSANPGYGQQYNITGTPTFIASNGDRLVGFQELDVLKKFLDDHK